MKRIIKFRAFSAKSGMWNWEKLAGFEQHEAHPVSCLYSSDDWTVMQFTGLKDSNGVEIYEGDVVSAVRASKHDPQAEPWKVIGQVKYDDDSCCFVFCDGVMERGFDFGWDSEYEVIGNIFENPELLTQI